MFRKYHYLSHSHNNAAMVFDIYANDVVCGFLSVLHFPHPRVNNFKSIHRVVVHPDYQGIGIGMNALSLIGKCLKDYRVIITTSTNALTNAMKKSTKWRMTRTGRTGRTGMNTLNKTIASNRVTNSFEYTA